MVCSNQSHVIDHAASMEFVPDIVTVVAPALGNGRLYDAVHTVGLWCPLGPHRSRIVLAHDVFSVASRCRAIC